MKLLLDQNLSHRLVKSLNECYPGSNQVALLNMGDADDKAIWDYAKENDYVIVTQDADFQELSMLLGGPPQIIWLTCGNQRKAVVLEKPISQRDRSRTPLKTRKPGASKFTELNSPEST